MCMYVCVCLGLCLQYHFHVFTIGESGEIIKVFNQEKREDYAIEERLLPAMGMCHIVPA